MSSEADRAPNELKALRAFVRAHEQTHPRTGSREPILFMRFLGGSQVHHHGFQADEVAELVIDEALIEDLSGQGFVSLGFSGDGSTWKITPTPLGRAVVDEADRTAIESPSADPRAVVTAVADQANDDNPLSWPAVRPVLTALHRYWQESGFPEYGIVLSPLANAIEEGGLPTFAATIRALNEGGYLAQGGLTSRVTTEAGRSFAFPAEVALTEKARSVVDGWPGAAASELVENLLAVLARTAQQESDPIRRGRLEALIGAIKEVGVSVTSDVIAKVVLGAA